jgi:hypothetical protein
LTRENPHGLQNFIDVFATAGKEPAENAHLSEIREGFAQLVLEHDQKHQHAHHPELLQQQRGGEKVEGARHGIEQKPNHGQPHQTLHGGWRAGLAQNHEQGKDDHRDDGDVGNVGQIDGAQESGDLEHGIVMWAKAGRDAREDWMVGERATRRAGLTRGSAERIVAI